MGAGAGGVEGVGMSLSSCQSPKIKRKWDAIVLWLEAFGFRLWH